jgi:RimJ/RimL family protein N-acetyltransferase
MFTDSHFQITTPRFSLTELQLEDIEPIYLYRQDPAFKKFMLPGQTEYARVEAEIKYDIWTQQQQPRPAYGLAIRFLNQPSLIGTCSLHHITPQQWGMVGWDINPLYWGQGIATEATKYLLQFAFEQLNLKYVVADCGYNNVASRRVMKKAGMIHFNLSAWHTLKLMYYYRLWTPVVRYGINHKMWRKDNQVVTK